MEACGISIERNVWRLQKNNGAGSILWRISKLCVSALERGQEDGKGTKAVRTILAQETRGSGIRKFRIAQNGKVDSMPGKLGRVQRYRKNVKSIVNDGKRRRAEKVTNKLSHTNRTVAMKQAAIILRDREKLRLTWEDSRRGFIKRVITTIRGHNVLRMKTFEVDEMFQEDEINNVTKARKLKRQAVLKCSLEPSK